MTGNSSEINLQFETLQKSSTNVIIVSVAKLFHNVLFQSLDESWSTSSLERSLSKSLGRLEYYFQGSLTLRISLSNITHTLIRASKSWHEQLLHLAIFRSKSIDFLQRISPPGFWLWVSARVCDGNRSGVRAALRPFVFIKSYYPPCRNFNARRQANIFKPPLCAKRSFFFVLSLFPTPVLFFFFFLSVAFRRPWPRSTITGNDSANWSFRRNNVSAWNYDSPFRRGPDIPA